MRGKTLQLEEYFRTGRVGSNFPKMLMRAKVPQCVHTMTVVTDFANSDVLLNDLRNGYIVTLQGGSEYLVPFECAKTDQVIVACVQCVQDSTAVCWGSLNPAHSATKSLKDLGLCVFPVLYAAVEWKEDRLHSCADGVLFTAKELFDFTCSLGPLRFHTQMLGKYLTNDFPWMQSSSLVPTVASALACT